LGELAPEAVECARCHALVHADDLDRIASEAKALEAKGELRQARELWLTGLPLLPAASRQAAWIRDHTLQLDIRSDAAQRPPQPENPWAKRLGPFAPIAVLLAKSKALLVIFKLNLLLSLAAFMGFYWTLYGAKFGVGFAVLILIHEMGHFVDIKRRGLPADMPVFFPGLGAYVRWQGLGVSLETRAAVSLAGPFAGWVASVACALLWWKTGDGIWAALARAGAWLNVLNLVPIWVLDGGQAAAALSKGERLVILTAALALWLFFGESVFFLVAAGAAWRLFTKDLPPQASRTTLIHFLFVMTALGVVMWLMPGKGFAMK
jgi:Zn-dependent protease